MEDKQTVLVGTIDGYIIQWSLTAAKQINRWKVSTAPTAVLKDEYNGNLFWGDSKGSVFALKNAGSNKLSKNNKNTWRFRNGASISHLTSTPNGLLVSSYDNFIYLISQNGGEIIWKKRFAGRIYSEPFIDGGYAIVMTTADSDASIIEMMTGKVVNKISLKDNNIFTNKPFKIGNQLLFPTMSGIFSFSPITCSEN